MKQLCKIACLALALLGAGRADAQLQLISQSKIDSIRNPRTAAQVPMYFEEGTTLNMGQMSEDDEPWTSEIRWRNRGTSPIVVTKVVTTCGCLKVDFDPWPVVADSMASMRIAYNPKGHPGAVYQRAMIYTSAAEDRPSAILVVSGEVSPALDPEADYPQTCGALRLRTTEVAFRNGGQRQQMSIACFNGGREPLRITTDTLMTSPALRVKSEPQEIPAGAEGELIITFDPSKAIFIQPSMPLYMRGLYLPLRQRQLHVRIH